MDDLNSEKKESVEISQEKSTIIEESKMSLYDYVLKNNNLEKTVDIIMDIIKHEASDEVNDF